MSNPVIIYVDDESKNLIAFKATMLLREDWNVHTFENPQEALEQLVHLNPAVIVSDQRMPVMSGVEFLEKAAQIVPNAIRIIATGQSAEDAIIGMIKQAKILDFIKKPWDTDDLIASIDVGIKHYNLEVKNKILQQEAEAWAPYSIIQSIREGTLKFPFNSEFVGITFDIVNSSLIHDVYIEHSSLRAIVVKEFTSLLMQHGGMRESLSGDSCYGHFGAFYPHPEPFHAALRVAQSFTQFLDELSENKHFELNCGIAIHLIDALIQVHTIHVDGKIQHFYDSQSNDIDLMHKFEKIVHQLPGNNIIVSEHFYRHIGEKKEKFVFLGQWRHQKHGNPVNLAILKSNKVSDEALEQFKKENFV
ncbi:MAG: response regulator [Silvanigrellaceae bacterium]|nr:response regulator [Silvanigrellaceae bacterium]